MKESIGNAFVSGLVIMFLFLTILILTFAINYSRANKIKNKILNYVANYAEKNSTVDQDGNMVPIDIENDSSFSQKIDEELADVGYRRNDGGFDQNRCTKDNGKDEGYDSELKKVLNPNSQYHYCIYSYKTDKGYYYGVETFMYFDIPIIGKTIEIPLYGETRVIYNLGNRGGSREGKSEREFY